MLGLRSRIGLLGAVGSDNLRVLIGSEDSSPFWMQTDGSVYTQESGCCKTWLFWNELLSAIVLRNSCLLLSTKVFFYLSYCCTSLDSSSTTSISTYLSLNALSFLIFHSLSLLLALLLEFFSPIASVLQRLGTPFTKAAAAVVAKIRSGCLRTFSSLISGRLGFSWLF